MLLIKLTDSKKVSSKCNNLNVKIKHNNETEMKASNSFYIGDRILDLEYRQVHHIRRFLISSASSSL